MKPRRPTTAPTSRTQHQRGQYGNTSGDGVVTGGFDVSMNSKATRPLSAATTTRATSRRPTSARPDSGVGAAHPSTRNHNNSSAAAIYQQPHVSYKNSTKPNVQQADLDNIFRRYEATGAMYYTSERPRKRFTDAEYLRAHYYDDHLMACYTMPKAQHHLHYNPQHSSPSGTSCPTPPPARQHGTDDAKQSGGRLTRPNTARSSTASRPPLFPASRAHDNNIKGVTYQQQQQQHQQRPATASISSRRTAAVAAPVPLPPPLSSSSEQNDCASDVCCSMTPAIDLLNSHPLLTPNLDFLAALHRTNEKKDERRQIDDNNNNRNDSDQENQQPVQNNSHRDEEEDVVIHNDDDDDGGIEDQDVENRGEKEPKTPPPYPPLSSFFPRDTPPRPVPAGAHISLMLPESVRVQLDQMYNCYSYSATHAEDLDDGGSASVAPKNDGDDEQQQEQEQEQEEEDQNRLAQSARIRKRREVARKRRDDVEREKMEAHRQELYRKEEQEAAKLLAAKKEEQSRQQREETARRHAEEREQLDAAEKQSRRDVAGGEYWALRRIIRAERRERINVLDILALRDAEAKLTVYDRERILQGEEHQRSQRVRDETLIREGLLFSCREDWQASMNRLHDRLVEEEELRRKFVAERLQEEHNEDIARQSKHIEQDKAREPLDALAVEINALAKRLSDERAGVEASEAAERTSVVNDEEAKAFSELRKLEKEEFGPVKKRFDIQNEIKKLPALEQAARSEVEAEQEGEHAPFDSFSPRRRLQELYDVANEESAARAALAATEVAADARGAVEEDITKRLRKARKKEEKLRQERLAQATAELAEIDDRETTARSSIQNSEFKARNAVTMTEMQARPKTQRRKSVIGEYLERKLAISSDTDEGSSSTPPSLHLAPSRADLRRAAAGADGGGGPHEIDVSAAENSAVTQQPIPAESKNDVFELTPQVEDISPRVAAAAASTDEKIELSSDGEDFEL